MGKGEMYSKVAFDKQHDLFVSNKNRIAADDIEPSLQLQFHPFLVFFGTCTGGGDWRGQSWHKTFRIRVDEVILELHKLVMSSSNISD
jgi:hypothetical protein